MRLKYIDCAKGFSMLFILWGHIVKFSDPVSVWSSSFKATLFYIVTGYLLSLRCEEKGRKTPVGKLALSSGVPYAFYSVLAVVAAMAMGLVKKSPPEIFYEKLIATFTLNGISTLWFLPSMFFGRFLFERLYNEKANTIFKGIFFIATPLVLCFAVKLADETALNDVFPFTYVVIKAVVAFWFMCVGFEGGRFFGDYRENRKIKTAISFALLIAGSVVAFFNKCVDINNISFGVRPILFFVSGCACSFGIIGIFAFVCEKLDCRLLRFVGENSLFIMVTHLPLYISAVVTYIVVRIMTPIGMTQLYICVICIMIVLLIVEAVLIVLKKKTVGFIEARLNSGKIKKLIKYI